MRLDHEWRRSVSEKESTTFFEVMNLLARPPLGAAERAGLLSFVDGKNWTPLAVPSLHREVLPLMRANAEAAGLPFEALFAEAQPPLPTSAECARAYFARRRRLSEIGSILHEAGIPQSVLIKGAAIGCHMPNPALRLMSDIDVLVSIEDLPAARQAMLGAGWTAPSPRTAAVRHESGWTLDLQAPATPLGEEIYNTARPVADHFHLPEPELHGALIAIHCFQGHGERVWRDVADYRTLRSIAGWRMDRANHALQLAARGGHAAEVEAFRIFLSELDHKSTAVLDVQVRERVGLLHLMAREQTSEVLLHLIRQTRRPYGAILRGLASRLRPARSSQVGDAATPRGLYDLPRTERLALGARFLLAGAVSGEARRLMRVGTLQSKLRATSLFQSPGTGCDDVG